MGKRFLLGNLGAPAGVFGSGVDGPRRNQLLMAQIIKILEKHVHLEYFVVVGSMPDTKKIKIQRFRTRVKSKHFKSTIYLNKYFGEFGAKQMPF